MSDFDDPDFELTVDELEARLTAGELGADLVHTAVRVFGRLGRDEAVADLLDRYLARVLPADEEGWARRELIDRLALLGRCDEAVEEHRAFLAWARRTLPTDRLLWALGGRRHAACWATAGRHEEWLATYTDLMSRVSVGDATRLDRLAAMRTAGALLVDLGRTDDAITTARRMRRVAEENPGWEAAFWGLTSSRVLQLAVYEATGQRATLRRIAAAVGHVLDRRREAGTADRVTLRELYAETAAPLSRAGEHVQALPLLERAVELGATDPEVLQRLSLAREILGR